MRPAWGSRVARGGRAPRCPTIDRRALRLSSNYVAVFIFGLVGFTSASVLLLVLVLGRDFIVYPGGRLAANALY